MKIDLDFLFFLLFLLCLGLLVSCANYKLCVSLEGVTYTRNIDKAIVVEEAEPPIVKKSVKVKKYRK